jgi:hypothetical protein
MRQRFGTRRVLTVSAILVIVLGATFVRAQRRFEFYILPVTDSGTSIPDLKASDLHFREGDKEGSIVNVEPYSWPVKLTVLVDNGAGGAGGVGGAGRGFGAGAGSSTSTFNQDTYFDNTVHFRQGLKKLFAELPRDIEVTLLETAPAPRYLVKPTSDPVQIAKGVDLLVPDLEFIGRFTDSLTEYAERLEREFKSLTKEQRPPYLPVLVSLGSTGLDGSSFQKERAERMLNVLHKYGVQTYFIMISPAKMSDVPENEGGTVLIAHAVREATGGQYNSIAASATSRLITLLPEIGKKIASRHLKQTYQYRVTVDRPEGATGPFDQNTGVSLSRSGVKYLLSPDGSFP